MLHRRYAPAAVDADTRAGCGAVRGAAAAVDLRRALALHRPARVRPRRVGGCRRVPGTQQAGARARRLRSRPRHRVRHRDHLTLPRASSSSPSRSTSREADPRGRQVRMQNLAEWQHGLLVHVPKGVELEKPLYVQVTSTGGSLFWRMVVVADEGARFTLVEDLSRRRLSRSPTRTRSSSSSPAGVEDRVRLAAEPLARDLAFWPLPRIARAGQRARLGDRRLRLEERQGLDRERPRR